LNRSFPGASSGSLAARLAKLFMKEVVSRCEAGIDLHSAAIHRVNLPQIRIDGSSKRARELAELFSPPVILTSKLREGSMRLAARQAGVDVLVYESGEALRFDENAVKIGVRGVLRVLHGVGMIGAGNGLPALHRPKLSRSSSWLRSPRGGILRARKTIGDMIAVGEAVAVVSDPFGDREAEVRADKPGMIIGRTNLPIVNEGDALFHVAEIGPEREVAAGAQGAPPPDEDEIV
jgi:predicted deacylase